MFNQNEGVGNWLENSCIMQTLAPALKYHLPLQQGEHASDIFVYVLMADSKGY